MGRSIQASRIGAGIAAAMALAGCHTDMWVQPKIHEPLQASTFYADGGSARPLVPNTVPRGHLREDEAFFTGMKGGKLIDKLPVKVTRELLERGQERYNIYCVPCHGRLGDGQGMIAQRGFTLRRPVGNYHTERLRKMPVGHFYDVITNGYGAMYSYAARVEPQDRWAIVSYIRALQLSQHATTGDLTPKDIDEINNPKPKENGESHE
jgi:mono/diheme cytochrome c family protein